MVIMIAQIKMEQNDEQNIDRFTEFNKLRKEERKITFSPTVMLKVLNLAMKKLFCCNNMQPHE